ncbi:GNAT family N-acetyltransferase [Paenibacillus agilis]|uniref:N-acetyltransferase n=1 Tax=Paenibacillus agilis TaxID=3020863 RepID=A0A559J2B7_9BACL|nr:GNAT family N-acetyltransferase [Paenibacillus agilis]TVX94001.1 N-acetyltransferase [Paenibacillus agilis]
MELHTADYRCAEVVARFFAKHIQASHDGISNLEFLCPDGAKAACRRQQVIIAAEEHKLVGALRFYRRKTSNSASLYQFALNERFRGNGVIVQMLRKIDVEYIEANCSTMSTFNAYYEKTGWQCVQESRGMYIWQYRIG